MNRKQRRLAEKKSGAKIVAPRTYTLTDADIKRIKDEAVDEALVLLLAIPVLVLHDKFGFGALRLNRFMEYVNTWIKAIHQDENTLAEVVKAAQEDASFELVIKDKSQKKGMVTNGPKNLFPGRVP